MEKKLFLGGTGGLGLKLYNFYMMPDLAARGMLLMGQFYQGEIPKHNEDLEMPYPDLSKFPIYTQNHLKY